MFSLYISPNCFTGPNFQPDIRRISDLLIKFSNAAARRNSLQILSHQSQTLNLWPPDIRNQIRDSDFRRGREINVIE
ncbi:hypothetical protein Hdeb2414_s0025g00668641 [Helianthus debilis subsp. tardiflorus]